MVARTSDSYEVEKRTADSDTGPTEVLGSFLRYGLRWPVLLTFALGIAAAIGAGVWMQQQIERKARANFAVRAGHLTDTLDGRLRAYSVRQRPSWQRS